MAISGGSHAAPLQIEIGASQFTTAVYSWIQPPEGPPSPPVVISNRMLSSVPITDTIYSPGWDPGFTTYGSVLQLEAKASAGLFSVESFAASAGITHGFGVATASALTTLSFSPVMDGWGTIKLEFQSWYDIAMFGAQYVRLFNLTAGDELWSYGRRWGYPTIDRFERLLPPGTTYLENIPWSGPPGPETATLTLDDFFSASDTYELTVFATTDSNPYDSERILIEWSGLEVVPEPSTFALTGLGVAVWLVIHGRRRNKPRQPTAATLSRRDRRHFAAALLQRNAR